jgi:hypothetical protein
VRKMRSSREKSGERERKELVKKRKKETRREKFCSKHKQGGDELLKISLYIIFIL